MATNMYDVVIIGGGIMGSSLAYNLMRADGRLNVLVVERDPTYAQASTTLSMTNARIQFSLKQNIQASQYAFDVFESFEEDMRVDGEKPAITYRREGNLFLFDASGREAAQAAFDLQKSLGCPIEWWPTDKIHTRYPLYDTKGYAGATFGPADGHFDAYAVLMAYKKKARELGAIYRQGEAVAILNHQGRAECVQLASGDVFKAGAIVNCAGAWAAQIAATAGVNLPVDPVKRQVFTLDTAVKPEGPLPLTVLPSGLYFRTETGGHILLGKSMDEDPVGFDFTWDDKRFTENLWFELAEFVPAFDTLKLVRGWAGLYAVNTLDSNAILGEWPDIKGLYLANGFSGHGLQQAPAVGRYLAELITGQTPVLDLSIFHPDRILENRPLSEGGLV
jgi:FAD-dependent oxidoreductase domain-containing protein 1